MPEGGADLTFDFVEDLARASLRRTTDVVPHLRRCHAGRIGPLLELLSFHRAGLLPIGELGSNYILRTLRHALSPAQAGHAAIAKSDSNYVGFIVTCRDVTSDDQAEADVHWVYFCAKAQEAAALSMPKPVARGLVAAIMELEDNIHLHSQRSHDGVVGFRGTATDFEFVVADSGIGILESLRASPTYQHLVGAGEAIKISLQDGSSRLNHATPGHGYGFRDLFVGLANLNGYLRFRSDDHAFVIDGLSPSIMHGKLWQQARLQGFVASVICQPRSNGR